MKMRKFSEGEKRIKMFEFDQVYYHWIIVMNELDFSLQVLIVTIDKIDQIWILEHVENEDGLEWFEEVVEMNYLTDQTNGKCQID